MGVCGGRRVGEVGAGATGVDHEVSKPSWLGVRRACWRYPLPCLVAVAVCALTAAGHDRLTRVGQWIKRASQGDLARLRAPWDPLAGAYRAPDEKTIRVVLDRLLVPQALRRALLARRPRDSRHRIDGSPTRSVRDYRAWRRAARVKALAR